MLKSAFAPLLAAILLASPAAAQPVPARESPEGWSFGKPVAPRQLIEYSSFGCGHCGLFAREAGPAIAAAVRAGRLRFDLRPFLIFPQDRPAAVLARCVAPARRFAFYEAVMADQDRIKSMLAAADADDTARGRLYAAELKGPEAHADAVARTVGLDRIAVAHGLASTKIAACLGNAVHHAWVDEADLKARAAGITGTPTFVLGGRRLPAGLIPATLKAALAR